MFGKNTIKLHRSVFFSLIKVQFQNGHFLYPFIFVALGVLIKEVSVVFILQPSLFYLYYKKDDFNFKLIYMSGIQVSNFLILYNLSRFFWFNFWLFGVLIISYTRIYWNFELFFYFILEYNIILFVSIISGNLIGNSILTTFDKNFFRKVVPYVLFVSAILFTKGITFLIKHLCGSVSFSIEIIFFVVILLVWRISINQVQYISNISKRIE